MRRLKSGGGYMVRVGVRQSRGIAFVAGHRRALSKAYRVLFWTMCRMWCCAKATCEDSLIIRHDSYNRLERFDTARNACCCPKYCEETQLKHLTSLSYNSAVLLQHEQSGL